MNSCAQAWMRGCLISLALMLPGLAQSPIAGTDKWAALEPPANGLLDQGGFFKRNPSIGDNIAKRLQQLHSNHDYRIYLVVEPSLLTTSAPDLASRLRELWLPEGDGIVAVYEGDTRSLGIGRDLGDGADPTARSSPVPTHETATIINLALAATDKKLPSEIYLQTLALNLTDAFERYFERRATPPPRGQSLRIALVVIGIVATLSLCAIAVAALTRLKSVQGIRTFHFRPVDRPERLGAPAGASVTSRSFRRPQ